MEISVYTCSISSVHVSMERYIKHATYTATLFLGSVLLVESNTSNAFVGLSKDPEGLL